MNYGESNIIGKCPFCKDVMIEGQHVSKDVDEDQTYHSSCLIQKLKKDVATISKLVVKNRHLTYLASPYTHNDMNIKIDRYNQAVIAANHLIQKGELVFTPIGHTHPIALFSDLPGNWQYWEEFDSRMINACDSITVLMLDGWRQSTGVQAEIKLGKKLNKQIRSMDATSLIVYPYLVD